MKKPNRKLLVKKADKAFGDYIKARDPYCVVCGTTENPQCGHLFTRMYYSTRWNENNAFKQCCGCNLRHEYDAYPFTKYFLDRFGVAGYDELHRTAKSIHKISNGGLELIIETYKRKLETLNHNQ